MTNTIKNLTATEDEVDTFLLRDKLKNFYASIHEQDYYTMEEYDNLTFVSSLKEHRNRITVENGHLKIKNIWTLQTSPSKGVNRIQIQGRAFRKLASKGIGQTQGSNQIIIRDYLDRIV